MEPKIQDLHVVIMAGGAGTRFWPVSTVEHPKQFIDILGTGQSLLQMTYHRALRLVDPRKIWVVTSQSYADKVQEQLPDISHANLILEPSRRNTAPCLAFAAELISMRYPYDVMLVVPADHLIGDDATYDATIIKAYNFSKSRESLLTIGMAPTRAETGYGYIRRGKVAGSQGEASGVYEVERFTEKPDLRQAQIYLESGNYLWNSGIFVWTVQSIRNALFTQQEEIFELFRGVGEIEGDAAYACKVQEIYDRLPNISLDYAILEKAPNVFVIPGHFLWSDLGSWSSVGEFSPHDPTGNAYTGRVHLEDCRDCVVRIPSSREAIVVGLSGYVISQTEDALLVCPLSREQEIRHLQDCLHGRGEEKLFPTER